MVTLPLNNFTNLRSFQISNFGFFEAHHYRGKVNFTMCIGNFIMLFEKTNSLKIHEKKICTFSVSAKGPMLPGYSGVVLRLSGVG